MVIPIATAAAQAVGVAGSAGATALGIGMGKSDLDLSRDIFKLQMRQTKRLWTADWAESSARHGEQIMQAAEHHAESQAMSTATFYQAEKLASQSIKLARDQDSRSYEMAWRAEVRESLRDELGNQNNRFNIIMLCDTVCLGCVFTLIADGSPPIDTPPVMLNAYVFCLGISIMLFSISLWGSIVVVRRLHDNTAARLERKLFALSEDLQIAWQKQLDKSTPTGPQEIYLVHQSYEKWVSEFIDPIGKMSIDMLSIGVVAMFITSGLLVHNVYRIEYDTFSASLIFWSIVVSTCTTMLYMKYSEDRKEKKKEGVYDVSWQDQNSVGPFAKISKLAEELFSSTAAGLGSTERMENFGRLERKEIDLCAKTQTLHNRMECLQKESKSRTRIRKELLQLLTTATEELDALPEELTSRTNKLLHLIDECDTRTADLVTAHSEKNESQVQNSQSTTNFSRLQNRYLTHIRDESKPLKPIDAQRIPVSLCQLRKKLGEISHTTLLRLRNRTNQPLRLKSGSQLNEGRYIKTLDASDPQGNNINYHLYPGTELPPKTEVLVAARSGGAWFPTSGIDGKIVYTNRDESWNFKVSFRNNLIGNVRRCRVEAYRMNESDDSSVKFNEEEEDREYWQISKDEYDSKANNEIIVCFDVLHGDEASKASFRQRRSSMIVKTGFLKRKMRFPLGLQWQKRWFVLTPHEIIYSLDEANKNQVKIALIDIKSVCEDTGMAKRNAFQIHTRLTESGPYCFSAKSPEEREDWIRNILDCVELLSEKSSGLQVDTSDGRSPMTREVEDSNAGSLATTADSYVNGEADCSIECVHHKDRNIEVLPV